MYRAFGFVDVPPFDGSEAASSGLDPFTIVMELGLDVEDDDPADGATS